MDAKLSKYEHRLIEALLRAHKGGLADLTKPFTSRQAIEYIAKVPTLSGTARRSGHLPNKYKLTFILKKSKLFTSEKDSGGRRQWKIKSTR
jgi:hypothetical protein